MTVEIRVLSEGYLSGDDDRVGSTVGFAREGGVLVVIDPGLVPGRDAILRPLAELELSPEQITDVVLSHHHPDHTLNAALFPNARVHDHWAWYRDDRWVDRPAEGFELSPSIRLIETPGHSPQDISTLVDSADGLVAFNASVVDLDGPGGRPVRARPRGASRKPRARAWVAGAPDDRARSRGAIRAGARHAPVARPLSSGRGPARPRRYRRASSRNSRR